MTTTLNVTATDSSGNKATASASYDVSGSTPTRPSGPGYTPWESLSTAGKKFGDVMTSVPANTKLTFGVGHFDQPDFNWPSNYPVYCMGSIGGNLKGIYGSGPGNTFLGITPNSSTVFFDQSIPGSGSASNPQGYRYIPSQSAFPSGTNPLHIARFDASGFELNGLTIDATAQKIDPRTGKPHNYNGVVFYNATGQIQRNVQILGVPGDNGANPGETFPDNIYKGGGWLCEDSEIGNFGGSGIGFNQHAGWTIRRTHIYNGPNGAAVTNNWSSGNALYEDCVFENCRNGLNFEAYGGTSGVTSTVTIRRCAFKNIINPYDLSYHAQDTSKTIIFEDPILAAGQKIRFRSGGKFPYTSNGGTNPNPNNAQKKSDIHVIISGKEVDPSQYITYSSDSVFAS